MIDTRVLLREIGVFRATGGLYGRRGLRSVRSGGGRDGNFLLGWW